MVIEGFEQKDKEMRPKLLFADAIILHTQTKMKHTIVFPNESIFLIRKKWKLYN